MDGWFWIYSSFNIIGHIEPGCQQREMSKMDETPLWTNRLRSRVNLNLESLVHKSRCWPLDQDKQGLVSKYKGFGVYVVCLKFWWNRRSNFTYLYMPCLSQSFKWTLTVLGEYVDTLLSIINLCNLYLCNFLYFCYIS